MLGIKKVGKLDDIGESGAIMISLTAAIARLSAAKSDEDKRIEAARAALFGVDSVVSVMDFEVGIYSWCALF